MLSVRPGQCFGRFTVVTGERAEGPYNKVKCKCECGTVKDCYVGKLRKGEYDKGCGCWALSPSNPKANMSHGCSSTPAYKCWTNLVSRHRKKASVDPSVALPFAWLCSFEKVIQDLGHPKSFDMYLCKRNASLPYSKDNCYWSTEKPKKVSRNG